MMSVNWYDLIKEEMTKRGDDFTTATRSRPQNAHEY
jgi:hypothetical protein